MPYSVNKTIAAMQNKSDELKKVFADAANSALSRGQSEDYAIFAGLAAVKIVERKNKPVTKVVTNTVPSHILAIVNKQLEADPSPEAQDRNLISADFDAKNRLVLKFDNGEQLISREIKIQELIEQNIAISAGMNPYDYIDFKLTSTVDPAVGRLTWNNTDGTLDLGLLGGNVTLQLGQEELIRVYNNTAFDFTDLQVIRITGSQGLRVTVDLAQASSENTSTNTFAVVTEPILKNQQGFATVRGLVREVDTSAFTEGAQLYLSPSSPGGITQTKPVAPDHVVTVGWCVRSHHINGMIYVSIQNGYELNELHNVKITSPVHDQVLVYNSTLSIWENKTVSMTGSVEGANDMLAKRTDVVDDFTIYQAEATAGVLSSASGWRIRLITISVDGDTTVTWANGNANYDKVWNDRLTYIYS